MGWYAPPILRPSVLGRGPKADLRPEERYLRAVPKNSQSRGACFMTCTTDLCSCCSHCREHCVCPQECFDEGATFEPGTHICPGTDCRRTQEPREERR